MAKQLSSARKFKVIRATALFELQKAQDAEVKKEDGEGTGLMEFA